MSARVPRRSEDELSDGDRQQLANALVELRAAVEGYEPYLGRELEPGKDVPVMSLNDVRRAQDRIESAEAWLWELREELLGWSRPPWAPPAALVTDWFSEEDAVYDDIPVPAD